jgi:hypothetical protein
MVRQRKLISGNRDKEKYRLGGELKNLSRRVEDKVGQMRRISLRGAERASEHVSGRRRFEESGSEVAILILDAN